MGNDLIEIFLIIFNLTDQRQRFGICLILKEQILAKTHILTRTGERMKKKKMLRSCIASFLTGSVSIIVQAHGVVGLSDAPIAQTIRPAINSDQLSNESLRQPSSNERARPLGQESSVRAPQNSAQSPLARESSEQRSNVKSGQVNINRSGYRPERRALMPQQRNSVSPNLNASENVERSRQIAPDVPVPSKAPSRLSDEMIIVEQQENVVGTEMANSELSTNDNESVARQSTSGNVPIGRSVSRQNDGSLQQPSEAVPSSSAVVQPVAENEPNESTSVTQDSLNFGFQRYQPTADDNRSPSDVSNPTSNVAASSSAAAYGEGISVLEAVQRAIAWHPSITEALGRLYQQGEQVHVAKSGYFPQLSAGISTEHRSSTGRSEDAFTVSASQMLYDFGRVSSEVEAANYGVDRDQARVWLAMDQLARDTSQAAIEVQRFQALLDIAQEQIAGIDDLRELAERRSQLGASTRSDEIQAQSRLESAEATQLQLEAQLKTWQNTVRTLVGANGPVNIKRDFPQPLTQSCALASEDFDNVPELMVAEAQQAEARAIIEQTQASFFPTASLDAGFNQFLNSDLVEDDNEVTVRFNLTSNLYQGGATSARRRAADFSLQATQAARDSAFLALSRSLRQAKEQTASFGLRLAALDARARSIRQTQDLYRQQYLSLGTRSLLDLLNAEQEIHQSRFDQENTRYDLYSLQIDCLYSAADIREAFNLEDSMVQGVSVQP